MRAERLPAWPAATLLGLAAATVLLTFTGTGEVFVMTAVCYAAAMTLIWRSGAHPLPVRVLGNPWRETVDSWKYVAATAMLPTVILLGSLHCGLTMTKDAILPTFTKSVIHGGGSALSLLGMGFAGGMMVGAFALSGLRTEEAKGPLFLITGLASGLTVVALAFVRAPLPAFLVLSVMGAAQGMFMALGNTLIQQVVPDELRGRVSSGYLMATGVMMSFGNLGAGAAVDNFGIPAVLIVPSLVFVAVVVALTAVRPGLRMLYRTGVLPGVDGALVVQAVTV